MNKYFKIFLQNAFFGGILIGVTMVLLEMEMYKLGGFLYGGIPIGLFYALIYYFFSGYSKNKKEDILLHFSNYTIIGGFIFIIIVAAFYYALRYTSSFIWATIAMVISTVLSYTVAINLMPVFK